ncbi:MAG TPA: hypothetical protein VJI69_07300 [Bacteroidia bacterium]|nr:hypothetical protein [Bacteroidia bacterium]
MQKVLIKKHFFNFYHSPFTSSGQSLFEVIIALGITALVLVGVISLSTVSVRNSGFARNDAVATKYAQEGLEWLREQRDENWDNLLSRASGNKLCIKKEPVDWGSGGFCNIQEPFQRAVTLQKIGASNDQIRAIVEVQWNDSQGTHTVKSATIFTRWN